MIEKTKKTFENVEQKMDGILPTYTLVIKPVVSAPTVVRKLSAKHSAQQQPVSWTNWYNKTTIIHSLLIFVGITIFQINHV